MNLSASIFNLRSFCLLPELPSKKEFRAALARIKALPKRTLAEVIAKVANPAEMAAFTATEENTLQDLLVLAMSMTRRGFLRIMGKGASLLGLGSPLPQLPTATDDDTIKAIQILNSRDETIARLIRQFLDIGHDDVWNHIVALSEENSVVAAEKLLNMIKTLPLREDFARVSYAAITNDFSKLTHLDWGAASFLIAIARDDKFRIYVEPLVERPFLYKHFVPRTGITPEHFERLLAVKEHCGNLPTEIANDETPPRAIKTNPLSPYMAYLLRTNARAGGGARELFEKIEDGYQPPSPPRGD